MPTIEQEVIRVHAPNSYLLDMALKDNGKAIIFCKQISYYILYDSVIKGRLSEALLSPVPWIRERATKFLGER